VITRVSSKGVLTKNYFISNIINLWFSFNLRFIMSLAVFVELETILRLLLSY
jgi:hypothetical protein